jgi:hypothetical protein
MWSPHNNLPLSLFLLPLFSPRIPQINNTNFLVCCFSPSQFSPQLLEKHDSEKQTTNVFLFPPQNTNLAHKSPLRTTLYNYNLQLLGNHESCKRNTPNVRFFSPSRKHKSCSQISLRTTLYKPYTTAGTSWSWQRKQNSAGGFSSNYHKTQNPC